MPRWLRAFKHFNRWIEIPRCVARLSTWPGALARYFGLSHRYPFALRTRGGITVQLETYHDLVTAWVIFCRDEYTVSPQAKLVIDLGANIGLFTLQTATLAPTADIVAVEPFPPCYRRLVEAVKANGLAARVVCWPLAVADLAGERFMPAVGPTQSNGLFPRNVSTQPGAVAVEAVTLPTLLAKVRAQFPGKPIDLLKIDVEGTEHDFFKQLPFGTFADVQAVGMEYHPNGDKTILFRRLAAEGLVCTSDRAFGANVGVAQFARR